MAKKVTIEHLAVMVGKGFEEAAKNLSDFRGEVNQRFNAVDERFDRVEKRLDRIENLLIEDHKNRIEKLEKDIKELKELLSIS